MEAQNDYDASWSSTTNWTIAAGSLDNSVAFDFSLAPIPDNDDATAVESARKSPLILCPTCPDSAPCEITITFAQRHEVQQVYVCSTARVFEIYYAPSCQSINEYLCTVRCGIATREEEVLQTTHIEEAALTHPKGAGKRLDVNRLNSESSLNTSEDDWVEVKAHDASVVYNGNGSLPSIVNGRTQDLYEATAEISDANPCISITLRLLSLQNKGCLFVDEVYVFADPTISDESEKQSDEMGNSGGSTLMAMLAPTLLQLSKTKGLHQIQNEHSFDTQEKEKINESGSNITGALNFANRIQEEGKSSSSDQQELKLEETVKVPVKMAHHEVPAHVSDRESKPDQLHIHAYSVLDQLVSRVSRVEDILLRFEEKMIKPISSLDTRLQQVEQQLEELTKKGLNPGLPSCTRYYAPEFSCCDFDPHSSYNIGKEPVSYDSPVSHEKDFSSSINDMDHSVNAAKPFPSLVVTAPDFPIADDEEEDRALGSNLPNSKPKNALSIDDALASALASFLSSTAMEPQKYSQALAVKAPDFSNEEDYSSDSNTLPKSEVEITSLPSCCSDAANGMDCIKDLASASSECLVESAGEVIYSLNDKHFKREAVKDIEEQCEPQEEGEDDFQVGDIECEVALARHDMEKEDIGNGKASKKPEEILVLEETGILNQLLKDQDYNGFDSTQEVGVENFELKVEAVKEGSFEGIRQNVLELPRAASVVDFETPILDVKFVSENNYNTKSPLDLEALLSDTSATDYDNPCTGERYDAFQIGEQSDLIPIMDEEETGPATGSHHIPLDENFYGISNIPVNMENDKVEEYHAGSNQELATASLI